MKKDKTEKQAKEKNRSEEYQRARKAIKESMDKKKAEKDAQKKKLKEEWLAIKNKEKELNIEVKNIKDEYHQKKKSLKKLDDKEKARVELYALKDDTYSKIETIKKQIYDLKFEYGKNNNTLLWNLKKWAFGVGKEFRRVMWSPPLLTIKYLGIIILIVLFLSLIFFGIFEITSLINK